MAPTAETPTKANTAPLSFSSEPVVATVSTMSDRGAEERTRWSQHPPTHCHHTPGECVRAALTAGEFGQREVAHARDSEEDHA